MIPIIDNTTNNETSYVDAFIIQAVQCQNCKNLIASNKFVMALNKSELWQIGKDLHTAYVRQNSVLCANPVLVVIFNPAIIDTNITK